jgi:single-stranded-DNA-specific exonuclease
MSAIVCLSHREDVDGIISAALVKAAFKTKTTTVILADYANIISRLQRIADISDSPTAAPDLVPLSSYSSFSSSSSLYEKGNKRDHKVERLFICDLGLSSKNQQKFVSLLKDIVSNGVKVTYIDHHDISNELAKDLKKIGVVLIHSIEECTSVQIYNKFKKKLNSHAAFFAASAALTDYMESRPLASSIISRYDRQFLMLEATALSYMISSNQNNEEFLVKTIETLAQMKFPHEIEGGFIIAERYAKKVSEAVKSVEASIVTKKNVAYTRSTGELSASVIVNFVLGISQKPVAMVFKLKDDINSYIISIRASKDCQVHLGRIVNEVASNVGGSGGGHEKASGALVPKDKLEEFIDSVDKRVVVFNT